MKQKKSFGVQHSVTIPQRYTNVALTLMAIGACAILFFYFETNSQFYSVDTSVPIISQVATHTPEKAFPVSVNPKNKTISENPLVESFVTEYLANEVGPRSKRRDWLAYIESKLALFGWYQNLASLSSRTLIIQPGERQEEIAKNIEDILKWKKEDRAHFIELISGDGTTFANGKFFPGKYVVARGATPEEVAELITTKYQTEVLERYTDDVQELVPLEQALIISSLIEREAYDFEDMRLISGVIWNRLFTDMKLQIDATLQYAKGSAPTEPWWPRVRPKDKYIDSPFNTYMHEGLPPSPISNSSLGAIIATLNPKKTDCLFYFHDKKGGFHCTNTYQEHVEELKKYYGKGK